MSIKLMNALLFGLSLALTPIISHADGYKYPPANLPRNDGMLGVDLDDKAYTIKGKEGIFFIKVRNVLKYSPAYGNLHQGDYIFNANGIYLRNKYDLISIVSSLRPGDALMLAYMDSTKNYTPKTIELNVIDRTDHFDPDYAPSDLGFRYYINSPTGDYDLSYDAAICEVTAVVKGSVNPQGKPKSYYDKISLNFMTSNTTAKNVGHISQFQFDEIKKIYKDTSIMDEMISNSRLMETRFKYCMVMYKRLIPANMQ